jgi:8-oxo-dGTP diphosphatase
MYTPIIGTLGYVLSPDQRSVLMVHRNKRESDSHLGKYNGLGGKMQEDEDVLSCMKREIFEETDLVVEKLTLRGTVNWTGFGPREESWLGFIFVITEYSGTPLTENAEGSLEWVLISDIEKLPMWEGDRHFLPLVFDGNPLPFHAYMPYKKDKVLSWQYQR